MKILMGKEPGRPPRPLEPFELRGVAHRKVKEQLISKGQYSWDAGKDAMQMAEGLSFPDYQKGYTEAELDKLIEGVRDAKV